MIEWMKTPEIYMYCKPLDFRKQMDGLIQVVASEMERIPTDGAIYLFRNRGGDKVKALMWDRNGFVLGYKRLERGRFDFPVRIDGTIGLNWEELYLLISGFPVQLVMNRSAQRYY